jgi:hypothetical protein
MLTQGPEIAAKRLQRLSERIVWTTNWHTSRLRPHRLTKCAVDALPCDQRRRESAVGAGSGGANGVSGAAAPVADGDCDAA